MLWDWLSGILPDKNFDAARYTENVVKELRQEGRVQEADRLENCLTTGATGTEVCMMICHEAGLILKAGGLAPALRKSLKHLRWQLSLLLRR